MNKGVTEWIPPPHYPRDTATTNWFRHPQRFLAQHRQPDPPLDHTGDALIGDAAPDAAAFDYDRPLIDILTVDEFVNLGFGDLVNDDTRLDHHDGDAA